MNDRQLEFDIPDRGHAEMMRQRLGSCCADERGFTLIELLVVTVLIGLLAAIALAVFLNQADKGKDASAKSNVTNGAHLIQACDASNVNRDDFRDCDTPAKLPDNSLPWDATPASEVSSGDCAAPTASDTISAGSQVRILEAGPACFTVLAVSNSGNRFWFIRHDDGSVSRDCEMHGLDGCPGDGRWAG